MWTSLSGKGKKIVFDEKANSSTKDVSENSIEKKLLKKEKKREKKQEKKQEKAEKVKKEAKSARRAAASTSATAQPSAEAPVASANSGKKAKKLTEKPSQAIAQLRHPGKLLMEEQWETYLKGDSSNTIPIDLVPLLLEKGKELLDKENDIYQREQASSRDLQPLRSSCGQVRFRISWVPYLF